MILLLCDSKYVGHNIWVKHERLSLLFRAQNMKNEQYRKLCHFTAFIWTFLVYIFVSFFRYCIFLRCIHLELFSLLFKLSVLNCFCHFSFCIPVILYVHLINTFNQEIIGIQSREGEGAGSVTPASSCRKFCLQWSLLFVSQTWNYKIRDRKSVV